MSICAIVSIDHCDITLTYFIKVTKDFKGKYESLRNKEIYSLLSKVIFQDDFVFLNRKRKSNFRLVPDYIHYETIVIHLVKVTLQDFKGSLMSLRNLYLVQNSLPLITNLFFILLYLSLYLPIQRIAPVSSNVLPFSLIDAMPFLIPFY